MYRCSTTSWCPDTPSGNSPLHISGHLLSVPCGGKPRTTWSDHTDRFEPPFQFGSTLWCVVRAQLGADRARNLAGIQDHHGSQKPGSQCECVGGHDYVRTYICTCGIPLLIQTSLNLTPWLESVMVINFIGSFSLHIISDLNKWWFHDPRCLDR